MWKTPRLAWISRLVVVFLISLSHTLMIFNLSQTTALTTIQTHSTNQHSVASELVMRPLFIESQNASHLSSNPPFVATEKLPETKKLHPTAGVQSIEVLKWGITRPPAMGDHPNQKIDSQSQIHPAEIPVRINEKLQEHVASPKTPEVPLDLTYRPAAKNAYQQNHAQALALRDPRSNSTRPQRWERFQMAMGEYECVAEKLLSDGTVSRGPGRLTNSPSEGANCVNGRCMHTCVNK